MDPIVKAIYSIMTVPLGSDDGKEYLMMKGIVLMSLDVLIEAGGLQKQKEEAIKLAGKNLQEMCDSLSKKPS